MQIAIPRERRPHERRVAATPDSVRKLIALGYSVAVEAGAGQAALCPDADYVRAGAQLVSSPAALYANADIVLKVQRPLGHREGGDGLEELTMLRQGCALVGLLAPHGNEGALRALAAQKIDAYALDLLPRISRAQGMDALSSQSNLAGYKIALDAAAQYGRALPMMMTAAGTIPPARALVMGAGVAGLQAIATLKRLGAIVSATDVRLAAKEQVQSLGATFLLPADAASQAELVQLETAGGYAREPSAAFKEKQAQLLATELRRQDIVIATALIPGRAAPLLVTKDMLAVMKLGSVVADLAVEQGGNCALSQPGEVVEVGGVTIMGHLNIPSRLAADASALYARNLYNFIAAFTVEGRFAPPATDEIVAGTTLTRNGVIVHPLFAGAAA